MLTRHGIDSIITSELSPGTKEHAVEMRRQMSSLATHVLFRSYNSNPRQMSTLATHVLLHSYNPNPR